MQFALKKSQGSRRKKGQLVDGDLLEVAQLPKYRADLESLEAVELLPPVLRGEHDVALTIPARVG